MSGNVASTPDYSTEWAQTLQSLNNFDTKQLEKLYQILAKCKGSRIPPNKQPIIKEDNDDNASVVSEISITTGSVTTRQSKSVRTQAKTNSSVGILSSNASINSYAALDDDNEEDSDDESVNAINNDLENTHLDDYNHTLTTTSNTNKPILQTRYIRIKILCAVIDCYAREAYSALHKKAYVIVAQSWTRAYDRMNNLSINIDQWFAYHLDHQTQNSDPFRVPMPDHHDYSQLDEIITAIPILADDITAKKKQGLGKTKLSLK